MSDREKIFRDLRDHAWLGRVYRKLRPNELEICFAFLRDNEKASVAEFEERAVRLFLYAAEKPKNFTSVIELLVCTNSEYRASLVRKP